MAFSRNTILTLVLLNVSILYGQNYHFDHYSVQNGLAQSTIYDIIQDQQGNIWLGTKSGVSRFNGIDFENYTTLDGLAENGVSALLSDQNGQIWMGHINGGISRYSHGNFSIIKPDQEITNRINRIVQDKNGQIWFCTDGSGAFQILNPEQDSASDLHFKYYKGEEGLSDRVFSISEDLNGKLYFIMDIGIKSYDPEKQTFEHYQPEGLSRFSQITVMHNSESKKYFGSWTNGLQVIDLKDGSSQQYFKRNGLADNFLSAITEDKNGNIWIGSWGGGISRLKDDQFLTFNKSNGLDGLKIWKLFIDREGNLLIGTNEHGLYIYKGDQFVGYDKSNGLYNNQVFAICQTNEGHLWIGTNEGISILNESDTGANKFHYLNATQGYFAANQVRFIKKDKNGNLWIGTNDKKLWMFDMVLKKAVPIPMINRWFPPNLPMVTALEIDADNNLWIGTAEGLIYYEIDNRKVAFLTSQNGLAGNDISALYAHESTLWVGCRSKGLCRIDGDKISRVDLHGQFTPTSIISDDKGQLWIGTEGQGILIYSESQTDFLTLEDGLLSSFITLLSKDKSGNIYIGSNLGLNKYNIRDKKLKSFTQRTGFDGIEVKNNASYLDQNGRLWFGTVNGVYRFNPENEIFNTTEPLTSIKRFEVNFEEHPLTDGIKLKYWENSINFDINSICLQDPEKIRYAYMLKGVDELWHYTSTVTHIAYPVLTPGKYVFVVKAMNNEGLWNKEPVSFSFKIKPPFWKTWWFFVILAILLALAIVSYIRYRTKKLIREKRILEEKVQLRTREVVRQKEQIEKEKAKTEELLLNILPLKVVDELKHTGKTEPESFNNVSAFFSDLVGFTDQSGKLEPKTLINELNDMFTAFDDIMVKNNCERLKTIGDAYLAVCGMPEPNENHAQNIVNAAIEIMRYLNQRNQKSAIKWRVRIGIHSGRVVGGVVGVRKYIYDVFGDTINTASRMESNSEPMKINISEATWNMVKNKYKFVDRGTHDVKGKGSMKMFFVDYQQ